MNRDAFERNKYNETDFVKSILSSNTIISYGSITAIDFDSVTVTLAVSDSGGAERVKCTFMNLGNELFTLSMKPIVGMRVIVLSPGKATAGMYESYAQININEGRDYIMTASPSIFSSQTAFCLPAVKSTIQALNSLVIDSSLITAELKHSFIATLYGTLEIDLENDSNIELHEGTSHFQGCYGNMEKTFGVVEGINGAEKEGDYVYTETYGKYASVEKNYESGLTTTIGKAYETPFLDDKGALVDSSAPVTINLGSKSPLSFTASAPVTMNMGAGAPVTLNFGGSAMVIKADDTAGFELTITGAAPVKILADTELVTIGNSIASLKGVFDDLITALEALVTIGGPVTQTIAPATVAALDVVKAKIATIFG